MLERRWTDTDSCETPFLMRRRILKGIQKRDIDRLVLRLFSGLKGFEVATTLTILRLLRWPKQDGRRM